MGELLHAPVPLDCRFVDFVAQLTTPEGHVFTGVTARLDYPIAANDPDEPEHMIVLFDHPHDVPAGTVILSRK